MEISGLQFPEEVLDSIQADRRPGKLRDDLVWKVESDIKEFEPQLEAIMPHVRGDVLVDIGTGRGVKAVMLALRMKPKRIVFVDGDGTGPRRRNYRVETVPWADVRMAGYLALANGLPQCEVYTPGTLPVVPTNFIISQLSWAHHYPATNYMLFAQKSLGPEGRMVVDIRKKTDGLAAFAAAGFMSEAVIEERPKRTRHVFRSFHKGH